MQEKERDGLGTKVENVTFFISVPVFGQNGYKIVHYFLNT